MCARAVTGSLYSGQVYGLHSLNCLGSGTLLPDCNYQPTVVYIALNYFCSDHYWHIASCTVGSSITVILIVWYCIGVFSLRAMASDDWAYEDESGPSYAPSGPLPRTFLGPALDIRSDSVYDLPPELQDVMGLRAVRPGAVVAKVASPKEPIPSDRDLLVQRLLGTLAPSQPVVQKRSAVTDLETVLLNWLPVGTVKEDTAVSPRTSAVSADRCFSCGISTHTTDNCRTLDESFLFLPIGWRTERVGDEFILTSGSPARPEDQEMGNDDRSGERGWSPGPAMPTDPNPQ